VSRRCRPRPTTSRRIPHRQSTLRLPTRPVWVLHCLRVDNVPLSASPLFSLVTFHKTLFFPPLHHLHVPLPWKLVLLCNSVCSPTLHFFDACLFFLAKTPQDSTNRFLLTELVTWGTAAYFLSHPSHAQSWLVDFSLPRLALAVTLEAPTIHYFMIAIPV